MPRESLPQFKIGSPQAKEIIGKRKELREEIANLRKELEKVQEEINFLESQKVEEKTGAAVERAEEEVEKRNEIITRERVAEIAGKNEKSLGKFFKKIFLPIAAVVAMGMSYETAREYYSMWDNWKERHIEKTDEDDTKVVGLDTEYVTTDTGKATYDFLGEHKVDYKNGYYMTSVFDLSDRTPPRFRLINSRDYRSHIDNAAGITTSFLGKFETYDDLVGRLRNQRETDEEIGQVSVVAYNPYNGTMRAGHLREFGRENLLSPTEEKILNFELNSDGTVDLVYDNIVLRMVPVMSRDRNGRPNTLQIGVTRNKGITRISPGEATGFGVLEGGKVLLRCGDKQVQVNGSFADIFQVYQKLKADYPNEPIRSFLLDNGAYNLPIWSKRGEVGEEELRGHFLRHNRGGTALVLMNDGSISPYEYKNKYPEVGTPRTWLESKKSSISIFTTPNNIDPERFRQESSISGDKIRAIIRQDGTRNFWDDEGSEELKIALESDSLGGSQFSVAQMESLLEYIYPRLEKYGIPLENINPRNIDPVIWEQLKTLISKKFYETKEANLAKVRKDDIKGRQLLAAQAYKEAYRVSHKHEYATLKARQIMQEAGATRSEINKTLLWLQKQIA